MKKIGLIATVLALVAVLAGCETEAQRVSYNLSQQADNFNDIRQVTVINCLQGDEMCIRDRFRSHCLERGRTENDRVQGIRPGTRMQELSI